MTKRQEDISDISRCPHCNNIGGYIIDDYTGRHNREVLIECDSCDKLYKIYYKFDRIVELNEKEE